MIINTNSELPQIGAFAEFNKLIKDLVETQNAKLVTLMVDKGIMLIDSDSVSTSDVSPAQAQEVRIFRCLHWNLIHY